MGRFKIYKFWYSIRQFDLENALNWRSAEKEINKTKQDEKKSEVFAKAREKEEIISNLKPKGGIDYLIYMQVTLVCVALLIFLVLNILVLE